MSVGEHITVFMSIIMGLAIADLGLSFHRLMQARARVEWHWLSLMAAVFMLLNVTIYWFGQYYIYSGADSVNLVSFLPEMAIFLLLFLSVASVFPDEIPVEGIRLSDHYFSQARYFWTLIVLNVILTTATTAYRLAIGGSSAANLITYLLACSFALATSSLLVFSRRVWVHTSVLSLIIVSVLWSYLSMTIR